MFPKAPLHNTIFLLRHGHSVANQQSLIVGDPEIGIERFGLSEVGVAEVHRSLKDQRERLDDIHGIYASDFLRTRQTAEIASEVLGVPIRYSDKLRERRFGDWEQTSNTNYQRVWDEDYQDASHQQWNVESVGSVSERMCEAVREIDDQSQGQRYLIVSHGDPLQILLTAASGVDLRRHRDLRPLGTAEIRLLVSSADLG